MSHAQEALSILAGYAEGPVVALSEALSFWGGVDPSTGRIIDARHPQHGAELAGAVVVVPTSRGSCSGSGVVLELALAGRAPAALIFSEPEDVATLGALVAAEMFGHKMPVLRLPQAAFDTLISSTFARITPQTILADGTEILVVSAPDSSLALSAGDLAMLAGERGKAAAQAMRILISMGRQQGAAELIDVTRAHIDGCIYAGPANLVFAETMEAMGARVGVPTTMNAISVDRQQWEQQGVPPAWRRTSERTMAA